MERAAGVPRYHNTSPIFRTFVTLTGPAFFVFNTYTISLLTFQILTQRILVSPVFHLTWENASAISSQTFSFLHWYRFILCSTLIFSVNGKIMYFLPVRLFVSLKSEIFFFSPIGEAKNRKYNASSFHRFNLYGAPTPHFNDGRTMAKTLYWLHELQM